MKGEEHGGLEEVESESENRSLVSDSVQPHGLYSPWNSPGQNIGVDKPFPSPGGLKRGGE